MVALKGGDKLEAYLSDLAAKVSEPGTLRVGFLEDATYPNGTPVAMVAAIDEFGAPNAGIPPRPYFRHMIADKSPEWGPAIGNILPGEDYDATKTLDIVGEGIAGQLRQSIIDTNSPPLSPVTLMLRKMRSENQSLVVTGATVGEAARRVASGESTAGVSAKPLVDSGHMLNSVDHDVKK
jgi:hypothetical protein